MGVARSKGQKKIPRKEPLDPAKTTPAAAAAQGTWQKLLHFKLVMGGGAAWLEPYTLGPGTPSPETPAQLLGPEDCLNCHVALSGLK